MEGFSKEKLKRIRLQLGLSQRDVPLVAQDTVSALESGRREPRPSTLKKLAEAYGVEVRDFFEGAEEATKEPPVSPSPEWALAAPDKEFDSWVEEANATELHKFWNVAGPYARGIEDDKHRALLLERTQKAIDHFFKLQPIEGFIDRRTPTSEGTQGRKAG